jgi:hypothetical protein
LIAISRPPRLVCPSRAELLLPVGELLDFASLKRMTKRLLTVLVVGALAVGGATAVIASSISSSSDEPVHMLPGGRVHKGTLPGSEAREKTGRSVTDQVRTEGRKRPSAADRGTRKEARTERTGVGE